MKVLVTRGWLRRFKERHSIKSYKLHGEASSVSPEQVNGGRQSMVELLQGYDPSQIFNVDETGVYYKLKATSTLATAAVKGEKINKDRVTVALCCNSTGTIKMRPFVIGLSAKPRCFTNFTPGSFVTYRNSYKAWMTSILWEDLMTTLDSRAAQEKKTFVVLCDNAACHKLSREFQHLKIIFLPPNTTSSLQPLDAGIIKNFKDHYKRFLARHYVNCAESGEPMVNDLRKAITMISRAWGEVTEKTIRNCWRKTRILPGDQHLDPNAQDHDPEDDLPLSEVRDMLRRIPNAISPEEFFEADENVPTSGEMTTENIISIVTAPMKESEDDNRDDQDDEPAPDPVGKKQFREAANLLIRKFEEEGNVKFLHYMNEIMDSHLGTSGATKQTTLKDFFGNA